MERTGSKKLLNILFRPCVWCVLLGLSALPCSAQTPFTFRTWTTQDGLPENQVTCITQTRDGYLWVGTDDGLARFDGVRFVNFGLRDGLRSSRIRTLLEDNDGTLWIGTIPGGFSRLRNGRIDNSSLGDGLSIGSISQMAKDGTGQLWAINSRALARWQEDRFVIITNLPADLHPSTMLFDHAGTLWLTTYQAGLWRFQDGKFSREASPDMPEEFNSTCHRIWEDRFQRLWVSAGANQLFCRETNGWRGYSIPMDTSLPILRSLAEEADGTMWAGSIRNGLYYVHEGQMTRITSQDGLSENGVESLLVDCEGNIWVGTIGGGLNRLTRKKVRAFGREEGLGYPVVRGIAEIAPGELWVGTRGDGLYQWRDDRFTHVNMKGNLAGEVFYNSLLQVKDGSCWAATGHGIYRFVNGQPEAQPKWGANFQETGNFALCEDRAGGVWAGASTTLWHLQNGQAQRMTNVQPRRTIIALAQEPTGAVWLGTEGDGLYRAAGKDIRHYDQADGLRSDQVRALHFDAKGTLWIGTANGGLTRLKDGRFFTVTKLHGLPDDTISQILEDDRGYLWLGCNRGIARLDKAEIEKLSAGDARALFPTVLTMADGLPSEECTGTYSPAGLKLASGKLCFATLRGIVMVDPEQEWQATPPPDVWLEEVLIDGVPEKFESKPAGPDIATLPRTGQVPRLEKRWQPVVVPPGRHRFEFHYTGLNLTAPNQVRFRYKLEGLDADWETAGTERTAYYNYIPPGSYTFRVIACNKDGVWNEAGTSLALTVQPFFWQRPWFSTVVGLGTIGMIVGIIALILHRRYKQEQARLEALTAIEKERTRIAKDIHDDLGATLSAIRLLSKFGQSPEMPEERMREDMRQIAAKSLASTQALDEIVWAVDPQADSLESFVNYACAFANEQLALAEVRCRLDLPPQIPIKTLQADVRHNLFLAFKEVITNILKHAAATEVQITMKITSQNLVVTVSDNGRGLPQETGVPQSVTGHHGIPNLHDRVQRIGGSLELESSPGRGVTARLRIPL